MTTLYASGEDRSRVAEQNPQLPFVATSNFPQAVDSAFTSRCDLIMHIPLPDAEACGAILKDCLVGLGRTYPAIDKLITSPHFRRCAAACVGLDGRAIRKMVANALASNPQTAMSPDQVSIDQLLAAAQAATVARSQGGKTK